MYIYIIGLIFCSIFAILEIFLKIGFVSIRNNFIAKAIKILGIFGILIILYFNINDVIRKQSAINNLDRHSLSILVSMDGLIFDITGPEISEAMRYLMDLDLVKMETFPSEPASVEFYLTKLGRSYVTNKLKIKLYPEILCDLSEARYWKDYPKEFLRKKTKFKKKYGILWDECWENLSEQIKKADSELKGDALAAFNSYKDKNSFDTVMNKIVNPWLKQIGK